MSSPVWPPVLDPAKYGTSWRADSGALSVDILTPDGGDLDLAAGPMLELRIRVKGAHWNGSNQVQVRWRIRLPATTRKITIEPIAETQGEFEFAGNPRDLTITVRGQKGPQSRLALVSTVMRQLHVRRANVEVLPPPSLAEYSRQPLDEVTCDSAMLALTQRNVSHLRVEGRSTILATNTPIGDLNPSPTAVLTLRTSGDVVRRINPDSSVANNDVRSRVPDMVLERQSNARVRFMANVSVVVRGDSLLEILESGQNLAIRGPGVVKFGFSGLGLAFEKPPATLSTSPYAQIGSVLGRVILGEVSHSGVLGQSGHREARRARPTAALWVCGVESVSQLTGLTITEFAVPMSLTGLQVITALQDAAHHASPAVHKELPGLRGSGGTRADRQSTAGGAPGSQTAILRDQYARSLSALAATKGASASVRTLLAWCAYRTRSWSTRSGVERATLSLYRLIGYGERVMPAIGTYALAAAIAASFRLGRYDLQLGSHGIHVWLSAFIDWLATPLHILNFTQDEQQDWGFQSLAWNTFWRVIIAVPFATAVLALRKYVKRGPDE